jgi:hypothetical protein
MVPLRSSCTREAPAQEGDRRGHFLLADEIILGLLCGGLDALPGQAAARQVDQHISQCFDIVASALFYNQAVELLMSKEAGSDRVP